MLVTPKSWKVLSAFLIAAGMSMGTYGSAQAGDCCYDSCCEPDCVFSSAGDRLCGRLKSMCGLWSCDSDCCVDDCCIDDCCVDDCCTDDCCGCCDEGSGWTVGGWAQMGYYTGQNGLFNQFDNRINFQQNWLYVEKTVDGSCGWDFGGRMDIMYGTDAQFTQAFGNAANVWDWAAGANIANGYGWALPQAYIEAANGDWTFKAGHFYTLLGYESVMAPNNFFYSHAFTMFNSEAFTHTGLLATHATTDNLTTYAGWTLGWDTGFDQNAGGSNFLGGGSMSLSDNTSLTYITTIGDLGWLGTGYTHSLVLDHTFGEDDKWNYVFQSDYVDATAYNPYGIAGAGTTEAYGINQYLIYNMTDKVGLGTRFEWWRAGGEDNYSATFGANVKPMDNLIIRPEVRYFFADTAMANAVNGAAAFDVANNPGDPFDGFIFGIDAILSF
ncbi:MAG: porin [Planctomycetaceae bacterium]|nr:porin [Planctomycetaceae bacterium]